LNFELWFVLTLAIVTASPQAVGDPQVAGPRPNEIVGITAPCRTATLASVQPSRIARIETAEGSFVRRGDPVVQLEEGVQLARTEIAKATAETTLNVEHAKARWMRAQRDLDRLIRLHGSDSASSKELSDATADAEITRIEYELANFNQGQAVRAYEREKEVLKEFRLIAPFDGYVFEHLKHAGETVNELEGIVTLVQLNPLKVSVDCPVALAATVTVGDRFRVAPVDRRLSPRVGTVMLTSRTADGGSQTFKVKLHVDNEDVAWMAGLKVVVDFARDPALAVEGQPGSPFPSKGGDN
jgi:membrane fusion protein (multidrug efflux system)